MRPNIRAEMGKTRLTQAILAFTILSTLSIYLRAQVAERRLSEIFVQRRVRVRREQWNHGFVGVFVKTRRILKPLYNCPLGIQVPELETRKQPEFPISDTCVIALLFRCVIPTRHPRADIECLL
jgi:hypothetical protein